MRNYRTDAGVSLEIHENIIRTGQDHEKSRLSRIGKIKHVLVIMSKKCGSDRADQRRVSDTSDDSKFSTTFRTDLDVNVKHPLEGRSSLLKLPT